METEQERRELKSAMPKTDLGMEHTGNCRVLPDRGVLLDRLPGGGTVAEIGVAFGDFTRDILARNRPACLYLIDAWSTERYQEGKAKIEADLSEEIGSGRVHLRQGFSTERLAEFDDHFFDWIYIDTNHTYPTTLEELELGRRKVKPNGRIAGHDFCTGNVITPVPYGVVEATTHFCKEHDWQFEYLTLESHGHFSFCLRPIWR
jgi:hypothetical protein